MNKKRLYLPHSLIVVVLVQMVYTGSTLGQLNQKIVNAKHDLNTTEIQRNIDLGNYKNARSILLRRLQQYTNKEDQGLLLKLQVALAKKENDYKLSDEAYEKLLLLYERDTPEWEDLLYNYYVSLIQTGRTNAVWQLSLRYPSHRFLQDYYVFGKHGELPPLAKQLPKQKLYSMYLKDGSILDRRPLKKPTTPLLYEDMCIQRLSLNWNSPTKNQPNLEIIIDKDGHCISSKISRSSGSDNLDRLALNLARSTKFPPIPAELLADLHTGNANLLIHFQNVVDRRNRYERMKNQKPLPQLRLD
jgi:TonB family protein